MIISVTTYVPLFLHIFVLFCVCSGGSIVFVSSVGGYNPFEVGYFGGFQMKASLKQ